MLELGSATTRQAHPHTGGVAVGGMVVGLGVGVRVPVGVLVSVRVGGVPVAVGEGVMHGSLYLSISVWYDWPAKLCHPTAHTSLADTATTPSNSLILGPGLGLGTTLQALPS